MNYPSNNDNQPDAGKYLPVLENPFRPTPPPLPPPLPPERDTLADTQEFHRPLEAMRQGRFPTSISFPHIPTRVVFFPALRHELVVTYDAQVYFTADVSSRVFRSRFQEVMATVWRVNKHSIADASLSDTFFIGHSRQFAIVRGLRRVKGYVFFHQVNNLLYVSWRVAYLWRLSPTKLAIVSTIVSVFSFLFWLGFNLLSRWLDMPLHTTEWVIIFCVISAGWSFLGGTIGVLNILSGGFFLGWLREGFDEVFRDDINLMYAILGSTAEVTATELALERVHVNVGKQMADFSRRVPRL